MEVLAYTPTALAEAMSVSRSTIYRWMQQTNFPVVKIGGCTRIPAEAFRNWLAEQAEVGMGD